MLHRSTALWVLLVSIFCIAPELAGRLLLVKAQEQTVVDADGTLHSTASNAALVERLSASMPAAEAIQISEAIANFQQDAETVERVADMKQQSTYQDFVQNLSEEQALSGLREAASALRSAELLAHDPVKTFAEMEKEGMVPPHRAEEYRQNPELLVEDTLTTLYLTFLTFAGAAGLV